MAKFSGYIGFAASVEIEPGIWDEQITEHFYYGDIVRNLRNLQPTTDSVNDEISISNEVSIVADPFAERNFHAIRYVKFMGIKWKVKNAEVLYPRLRLTLGGVYNG